MLIANGVGDYVPERTIACELDLARTSSFGAEKAAHLQDMC